jgi:hypothetical protein
VTIRAAPKRTNEKIPMLGLTQEGSGFDGSGAFGVAVGGGEGGGVDVGGGVDAGVGADGGIGGVSDI